MSDDLTIVEMIRHNANLIAEVLEANHIENDWGKAALSWLEKDIRRIQDRLTDEERLHLINNVGSYFGECLCRAYQGQWVSSEYGWGVQMEADITAYPFSKVRKFVEGDDTDSFASMFVSTRGIIDHRTSGSE